MKRVTRRAFLERGSALAVAGSLLPAPAAWSGANARMRVAVIGLNGRGREHIEGFQRLANVRVVALCDVDETVLAARAGAFEARYGRPVQRRTDLRRVLDAPDIDAVSIATPDHWHALATIWACQAGKDVYVESPGSHTVVEGRRMVEAARSYGRIVQHDVPSRSSPAVREAVGLLRRGVIGAVSRARGFRCRWPGSIERQPPAPVPSRIDYDLWLGPAPERPFGRDLVHHTWHWRWDFGSGELDGQAVHQADMCMWGLGLDALPPRIGATGGRFL